MQFQRRVKNQPTSKLQRDINKASPQPLAPLQQGPKPPTDQVPSAPDKRSAWESQLNQAKARHPQHAAAIQQAYDSRMQRLNATSNAVQRVQAANQAARDQQQAQQAPQPAGQTLPGGAAPPVQPMSMDHQFGGRQLYQGAVPQGGSRFIDREQGRAPLEEALQRTQSHVSDGGVYGSSQAVQRPDGSIALIGPGGEDPAIREAREDSIQARRGSRLDRLAQFRADRAERLQGPTIQQQMEMRNPEIAVARINQEGLANQVGAQERMHGAGLQNQLEIAKGQRDVQMKGISVQEALNQGNLKLGRQALQKEFGLKGKELQMRSDQFKSVQKLQKSAQDFQQNQQGFMNRMMKRGMSQQEAAAEFERKFKDKVFAAQQESTKFEQELARSRDQREGRAQEFQEGQTVLQNQMAQRAYEDDQGQRLWERGIREKQFADQLETSAFERELAKSRDEREGAESSLRREMDRQRLGDMQDRDWMREQARIQAIGGSMSPEHAAAIGQMLPQPGVDAQPQLQPVFSPMQEDHIEGLGNARAIRHYAAQEAKAGRPWTDAQLNYAISEYGQDSDTSPFFPYYENPYYAGTPSYMGRWVGYSNYRPQGTGVGSGRVATERSTPRSTSRATSGVRYRSPPGTRR